MVKAIFRFLAAAALLLGATAVHASPVYDQVFPSPSTIKCSSDASCAILDHIRVQAVTYSGNPGTGSYTWTTPCGGVVDGVFYIQPTGATVGCFQMDGFSTSSVVLTNALANTKILVGNASNVATAVNMSADATIANTGAVTLANSGVTAGAYTPGSITFDAKGRATSANSTLSSGNIFVGNGSNVSAAVAVSGDASLANTGALTVTKSNSQPIVTNVASIVALGALTNGAALGQVAVTGYVAGTSIGGGIFDYTASVITPDGCVNFAASGGGTWVRRGANTAIADYQCDTLAHADAYAAANSVTLIIGTSETLAADTTLAAPFVSFQSGGIINCSTHAITITNAFTGPNNQQLFNCTSGTETFTGQSVLIGAWNCGPYGNSGKDYSACIQQFVTIVMRTTSGGNGPRTLDLRGNVSATLGLYFNSTITWPTNPANGTILTQGQSFVMNTANTPIFTINADTTGSKEGLDWSVIGDESTEYRWASAQPAANSNAVVFLIGATGVTNSQRGITIIGGNVVNAYGFIETASGGSVYNGWWDSDIEHINCIACSGAMINHQPPAGGSERQIYRRLLYLSTVSPTVEPFNIRNVGGLTFDHVSVDTFGSTSPSTVRLFDFRSNTNMNISNIHVENASFASSVTEMFYLFASTGNINGVQLATDTIATGGTFEIFDVDGISSASNIVIDNVSAAGTTSTGATIYLARTTTASITNFLTIGTNIVLDSPWIGLNGTAANNALSVQQAGQIYVPFFATVASGTVGLTAMVLNGGSNQGMPAYRNFQLIGMTYQLSAAIASGSLLISCYSGTTLIKQDTINSGSGTTGASSWDWTQVAARQFASGQPIIAKYQTSSLGSGLTLTGWLVFRPS